MEALLIDDAAALERVRRGWDDLAVAAARPFSAPAWQLAWWRHVGALRGGSLRVAVALDNERVAGVAPFFVRRERGLAAYRVLGAGTSSPVEPLGAPEALDRLLETAMPRPDVVRLEAVPADTGWPARFGDGWLGGIEQRDEAPFLELDAGSYEAWFDGKSSSFRKQMRRVRRQLEAEGAVFSAAVPVGELPRAIEAFARLHAGRFAARGGSAALVPGLENALVEAGRELAPQGRFRVATIEVGGEIVSAHVFVAAGGVVSYWLGGFDERWAEQQPALQCLLLAIEAAYAVGDRRLDLGQGAQPYKLRFASGSEPLAWHTLVAGGRGAAVRRAALAPARIRRTIARRVPPRLKQVLKGARA